MAVFTGRRLRDNNVQGTTTDNPLTNVATTLNSAGLANLSAVSSNHAVIVLDPLRAVGAPEIVIVTAHTGSATSATISRGAYGTSARQHAAGTLWVHPAVDADLIEILAADPSDFYEGQLWYRSDTDIFMAHTGSAAVEALPIGAWQTWTPTLTNMTLGSGTVTARYVRIGRTIHFFFRFVLGAGSAMGTLPTFSLPATTSNLYTQATVDPLGTATLLDDGTAVFGGVCLWNSTTTAVVQYWNAASTALTSSVITATVPMTWVSGDKLLAQGTYEAAA